MNPPHPLTPLPCSPHCLAPFPPPPRLPALLLPSLLCPIPSSLLNLQRALIPEAATLGVGNSRPNTHPSTRRACPATHPSPSTRTPGCPTGASTHSRCSRRSKRSRRNSWDSSRCRLHSRKLLHAAAGVARAAASAARTAQQQAQLQPILGSSPTLGVGNSRPNTHTHNLLTVTHVTKTHSMSASIV